MCRLVSVLKRFERVFITYKLVTSIFCFADAKLNALQKQAAAAAEKAALENKALQNSMMDSKSNQSLDRRLAEELASDGKDGKNSDVGDDDRKRNRAEDRSSDFDDKKKKDEEKPAPKIQDKSKPVSSTPVPGTPWYLVCVLLDYDPVVLFF